MEGKDETYFSVNVSGPLSTRGDEGAVRTFSNPRLLLSLPSLINNGENGSPALMPNELLRFTEGRKPENEGLVGDRTETWSLGKYDIED